MAMRFYPLSKVTGLLELAKLVVACRKDSARRSNIDPPISPRLTTLFSAFQPSRLHDNHVHQKNTP